MAFTPIQYFRKEDFPELKGEAWADKLFSKLNEFVRQTQFSLAGNLSIEQNISGFYQDVRIAFSKKSPDVIVPYIEANPSAVINKQAATVLGFPFKITNRLLPKRVQLVIVGKVTDITDLEKGNKSTFGFGVAWTEESDGVNINGIGGLLLGRIYEVRLLILCE